MRSALRKSVLFTLACASLGVGQAQIRPMFARFPADTSVQTASGTLPTWQGSFTYSSSTYPFTMVGTDPSLGSATTTVPVQIIPLKFVFSDGTTLDPTANVCGGTSPATTMTVNSPVFQPTSYTVGRIGVGNTQYVDAFQRANFWNSVSTTSTDYHVLLGTPTIGAVQTIRVPGAFGSTISGPCARIGEVNIFFFQLWLRLHIGSFSPNTLPLFLTYNTFFTEGGCCILGFHTAFGKAPNQLTVAVAAYSDPGIFTATQIQDIHALSHEIGEWMDDPLINNTVPGWSGGQVSTCSTLLEVGDPVTGVGFPNGVTLNNYTYHPEDLVFLPWFSHTTPSTSANAQYTFLGTYTSPPTVCN